MACLSESPAVHGRRLLELLQEQQEPFHLDVYLLEKGHSDRILASRSASITCWPGGSTCTSLQKLTCRHLRTCRDMMKKTLCGADEKNSLNWERIARNHLRVDSKRRSLVSTLELRCGRPVDHVRHVQGKMSTVGLDLPAKVLDIFNELLEVAYTPAFYELIGSKWQLDQSDKLLDSHECFNHEIPPLLKQKALSTIRELTVSELASSRSEWSRFQLQMREIAIDIGAALFEDIKEETILDIIGSHCTSQWSSSSL
ncbi:unnamed protein product [Musa acuminata subsp. malaccensis]|uniref:(wild Malaysian banana) hypothetical protein n=1 Tax=Musa acuminata subsp. malaccensis TaxID=214687 RepID=A0A804ICL9_MUSAM|nr:unnamed protein product [Musa acuminata subsp. malaccensis]